MENVKTKKEGKTMMKWYDKFAITIIRFLILVILCWSVTCVYNSVVYGEETDMSLEFKTILQLIFPKDKEAVQFFLALGIKESNCNPSAVGDNGNAVGILQIWPCTVDEANKQAQKLGVKRCWTYADRYDPIQSVFIVLFNLDRFCTKKRLGYEPRINDAARIHNGGPNGYKNPKTFQYGSDFMTIYNNIKL